MIGQTNKTNVTSFNDCYKETVHNRFINHHCYWNATLRKATMGRGKMLSEREQGQISGMISAGYSISKTASKIKRSRNVIYNYLQDPASYGKKANIPGGPGKLMIVKQDVWSVPHHVT